MFKSFWASQDQQSESTSQGATQSWFPSSFTSSSSSRPSTPGSGGLSFFNSSHGTQDLPQSPSYGQLPPAEAAGIIAVLRDKSVGELRRLLNDKDAYTAFLHSLEQVNIQNNLPDELRKETTQLASKNLEMEPQISELRNQCKIIRTTQLAAAKEKLSDLERRKDEVLKNHSPASLISRLHDSTIKVEEESDNFHSQLLAKEIDLVTFLDKSKKLRLSYHKRALLHLGLKTSPV